MQPGLDGRCQGPVPTAIQGHGLPSQPGMPTERPLRGNAPCHLQAARSPNGARKPFTARTFSSDKGDPVGVRTGRQRDTSTRLGNLVQRGRGQADCRVGSSCFARLANRLAEVEWEPERSGILPDIDWGRSLMQASVAHLWVRVSRHRARGLYRSTVRWLPGLA